MSLGKAIAPSVISLLSGLVFGAGLTISDMVNPAKVIGFLDVAGDWDPSLAFTMLGALLVTFPVFALSGRMPKPLATSRFSWPRRRDVDGRLLIGAMTFGAGWGLSGFCPGPALASLSLGYADSFVFVGGLLVGTLAVRIAQMRKPGEEVEPAPAAIEGKL